MLGPLSICVFIAFSENWNAALAYEGVSPGITDDGLCYQEGNPGKVHVLLKAYFSIVSP